jgi:RHS repeat-associated protein
MIEQRSYDAWGRPRDPITWSYNITGFGGAGKGITMRGYTMHEHLEMFSLINMNGRLYDPVLGRMLSPDNYIQAPDNTQSYNRYSYCINNPLKYTDPSGDVAILIPMIIGAAISATINTGVQLYKMSNGSQQNFNWTSLGISTLAGGLGGIAGAYGGAAVTATTGYTSGAIYGAGAGFAGGAVGGFVQGGLGAGNAGWDWNNAWTGAAWGAAGGAVIGGAISGLSSIANNRNFLTGRYTESYLKANNINLTGKAVAEGDLKKFTQDNFGKRIENMEYKPDISVNDGMTGGNEAITIPKNGYNKAGSSNIFLKSSTLSSDKRLFYTLDHELTHASHYSNGSFASWELSFGHNRAVKISEFYAYHGGLSVANSWNDRVLWQWTFNKMLSYQWR